MLRKLGTFLVVFLLSIAPLSAFSMEEPLITPINWGPLPGDRIVFDTDNNIGYLIHENGKELIFPIITGQQRYVRYLGLSYYAATPKKKWVAKKLDIQRDRYTYGTDGKFFRLYEDEKPTHYGIHTHAAYEIMFSRENRYQSMGCPIVTPEILALIEQTFLVNDGSIEVETI